jgi:glycosyltransferase involved in cell wall biosynthesis
MKGLRSLVSKVNYQNIFSRDFAVPGLYIPEMRKKLVDLLKSGTFDIIYADSAMLPYVYNLRPRTPTVLEFFSAWLNMLQQAYLNEQSVFVKANFLTQYWSFKLFEFPRYAKFDAGIYVSELHRMFARRFMPRKSFVIPPPIDLEYFNPIGDAMEPMDIVFTGQMNYFININSMLYFCGEVLPLIRKQAPRIRLHIVGRSAPESITRLASSSVVVTGEVPDIRPYFRAARVVVAPITLDDGGIKTKVLEAMGMAKAVVSTPIGAQGIGATHGENIVIARDSRTFAAWVVRLLQDAPLREQIGTRAREFIKENYSHEKMTNRLNEVFEQIAGSKQPCGRR